jgi:hypothetical protein
VGRRLKMALRTVALCVVLVCGACSMRVTGVVSDRDSGQPIGACTVSIRETYTHTDPTGRYTLRVGWEDQETIKFVAPGYVVQTKIFNAEDTRFPIVDADLVRLRASSAPPGARFDPYTGEPLKHEVPRFDPYTGQPLMPPPAESGK